MTPLSAARACRTRISTFPCAAQAITPERTADRHLDGLWRPDVPCLHAGSGGRHGDGASVAEAVAPPRTGVAVVDMRSPGRRERAGVGGVLAPRTEAWQDRPVRGCAHAASACSRRFSRRSRNIADDRSNARAAARSGEYSDADEPSEEGTRGSRRNKSRASGPRRPIYGCSGRRSRHPRSARS
jgi:hypothetical protein